MKKSISTGLAVIVAVSGLSFATGAMSQSVKWPGYSTIDLNSNGFLSKTEVATATDENFGKADANRDGTLSMAEFATLLKMRKVSGLNQTKVKEFFTRADVDGDGKLTALEVMPIKLVKLYERMDRDGNGMIDKAEWNRVQAFIHTH